MDHYRKQIKPTNAFTFINELTVHSSKNNKIQYVLPVASSFSFYLEALQAWCRCYFCLQRGREIRNGLEEENDDDTVIPYRISV